MKAVFVAGPNMAAMIYYANNLAHWINLSWGLWRNPEGENVRLVTKKEDLGHSPDSKLYLCPGWAQSKDTRAIVDIAKERKFEIVELVELALKQPTET